MKIVFYGNILESDIATEKEANEIKMKIISNFLSNAMEILELLQKMNMPRKIIKDFQNTLVKDTEIYTKIEVLKSFFGDQLISVDYIPVSKDLELHLAAESEKEIFLSNIGLEISFGMGDIKIYE